MQSSGTHKLRNSGGSDIHNFFLVPVAEKILDKKELEFYKWDGDLVQLLLNVRDELNKVAENWTREQKNHFLEETEKSFKDLGEILRLIVS